MLSSIDIQRKYVEFYRNMRNYIWPYSAVECLADLEIETYKAFPDVNNIRKKLFELYPYIKNTLRDDEDFNSAYEDFRDALDVSCDTYLKISVV